jgi:mono/diheme cytochrome c family protein
LRGAAVAALALAVAVGGCTESGLSPSAERGRQIYLAQCTACHNTDPAQPGTIGPPVKGSSRDLLEAKILQGTYPSGYTPKRPTKVMVPMPQVAPELAALADYLR